MWLYFIGIVLLFVIMGLSAYILSELWDRYMKKSWKMTNDELIGRSKEQKKYLNRYQPKKDDEDPDEVTETGGRL